MGIEITGKLKDNVTAKDLILFIIKQVGANGGSGHFIEYYGDAISNLEYGGAYDHL